MSAERIDHNLGCPADDTCDCEHIAKVNAALRERGEVKG